MFVYNLVTGHTLRSREHHLIIFPSILCHHHRQVSEWIIKRIDMPGVNRHRHLLVLPVSVDISPCGHSCIYLCREIGYSETSLQQCFIGIALVIHPHQIIARLRYTDILVWNGYRIVYIMRKRSL